ncbi:hypothetical protein LP418_26250 [Nocardioides sp. B-3]|nr:hypothetical protein [Nocardioides sp. B-3]UUZ59316.1 hypothetical protein LP418_26250 [Nocardioides sp. B-3]
MNTAHIDDSDAEATPALAESSTRTAVRRGRGPPRRRALGRPPHRPPRARPQPAPARPGEDDPARRRRHPHRCANSPSPSWPSPARPTTPPPAPRSPTSSTCATDSPPPSPSCSPSPANPGVARKVAVTSRHPDADTVGIVDRAIATAVATESPATVLELARAKTIEADPDHEAARLAFEAHRRYVALSRSDDTGYRTVIARVLDGDAIWVDALTDRVADILAPTHGHDHNRNELRALAFGWLARPADLLQLLLEHTEVEEESEPASDERSDGESEDDRRPVWAPSHLADTLAGFAALTCRQLASLRPKAVVHVHLTDTALRGQDGVARVEDLGPTLVQRLADLLGHADVSLQPVRDLNGRIRINEYEHPDRLKDHSWQLAGGDVFPYAPSGTRLSVDYDHPTPYDKHGPPCQTGTHNSGPLRRTHHRWKTFGGYQCRQSGPGRYLWRTPRGRYYLRDHTGTHPLDPDRAEMIMRAQRRRSLPREVSRDLAPLAVDGHAPAVRQQQLRGRVPEVHVEHDDERGVVVRDGSQHCLAALGALVRDLRLRPHHLARGHGRAAPQQRGRCAEDASLTEVAEHPEAVVG